MPLFFPATENTGAVVRRCLLVGWSVAVFATSAVAAQSSLAHLDTATAAATAANRRASPAPAGLPEPSVPLAPAAVPDSSLLLNHAPAFPGGEVALLAFIRERLRYPSLAARNRLEGRVIVTFWVDERGHPYGFGVLRGVGGGLDEEALRVLREMPDWAPGIISGKPTLLQMRLPIVFQLPR